MTKIKFWKKLNFWQNSISDQTQILTKLKFWQNSISDKTQFLTKFNFWQNFKQSFSKNNLTTWQPMRCTQGSVNRSRGVLKRCITPKILSVVYVLCQKGFHNTVQCSFSNTVQYNAVQYDTVQYNTLHYNTLQYNTVHALPYTTLNYNIQHYITLNYTTLHYTTLNKPTVH